MERCRCSTTLVCPETVQSLSLIDPVEFDSLIEVDAGIITACMPSFAKMLNHHLPPWPTLKARLKSALLSRARRDRQENDVTALKDSSLTHINEGQSWGERPYRNGTDSGAGSELGSLESTQYNIRSPAKETSEAHPFYGA